MQGAQAAGDWMTLRASFSSKNSYQWLKQRLEADSAIERLVNARTSRSLSDIAQVDGIEDNYDDVSIYHQFRSREPYECMNDTEFMKCLILRAAVLLNCFALDSLPHFVDCLSTWVASIHRIENSILIVIFAFTGVGCCGGGL